MKMRVSTSQAASTNLERWFLNPITKIASDIGMDPESIMPIGKFKAKMPLSMMNNSSSNGKLIVVTGITPTPAGEGKTTTVVGLTQSMAKLGHKTIATLREPSLGPVFGIKGGGTGGGKSLVEPQDEVNIHFTGDAHAVGSAHNLLAALTDNIANRGIISDFTPDGITLRRVTDVEERSLRQIVSGLGGKLNGPIRDTGFDIVAASEVMAILALASDLQDLRHRLSNIVVGYKTTGQPVTANDVGAVGSMLSLLRHAIFPNIVQTTEGQPVFIHAGPFGNIAHGCCSVIADKMALNYADYVLTEAGFGADLGFEKFMHIKARLNDLEPHAAVIVVTTRALKYHGGISVKELSYPNSDAIKLGSANMKHLISVIKSFGLPVVVAINKFPDDSFDELDLIKSLAHGAGADAAEISDVFSLGGDGAIELAESLVKVTDNKPDVKYMYDLSDSLEDKINSLATKIYNAKGVNYSRTAKKMIKQFTENNWGDLPICMAKTHLSISHNPLLKGCPEGYDFNISDVRASLGAGFIYPLAGNIMTMPGLPSKPRTLDVDSQGNILGL
ncbi:MAG: formate--tetrahydrofolate ligase [Chloroflexi bacterium]|nr:formate--tetrahydrofolate ligase [Chloroflexota bacterium]